MTTIDTIKSQILLTENSKSKSLNILLHESQSNIVSFLLNDEFLISHRLLIKYLYEIVIDMKLEGSAFANTRYSKTLFTFQDNSQYCIKNCFIEKIINLNKVKNDIDVTMYLRNL